MGKIFRETAKPSSKSASPSSSSAPVTTSSTSVTETVRGSHHFKITGYSLSKGIGIGKYVASDTFSVGGYDWAIYFYPDGKSVEDNATYVSLFIALASDGTDVRALFELTLLDQSGKERHKVHSHFERTLESGPYTLKYRGSMWGYKRFFKRMALETSDYVKDDCLSVNCSVGVVRSRTEGPRIYSIAIPPSNIGEQFGQLLQSGRGTDVSFEVNGEIFAAHKLVIAARSPVFRAQLFGPMKDQNTDCIKVEDMEAPVFKALLHFMYWDTLPDLHELTGLNTKWATTLMAQHLLAAADRYALERLRMMCEASLCEDVAINTVATTLALAEQHHCFQLKAVCLKFIATTENLRAVMQTDGFDYLKESCPSVLTELLEYVARFTEHSDFMFKHRNDVLLDGSDINGRRIVVNKTHKGEIAAFILIQPWSQPQPDCCLLRPNHRPWPSPCNGRLQSCRQFLRHTLEGFCQGRGHRHPRFDSPLRAVSALPLPRSGFRARITAQLNNDDASNAFQKHECAREFVSVHGLYLSACLVISKVLGAAVRKHVYSFDQTWAEVPERRKSSFLPESEGPDVYSWVTSCAPDHDAECVTEILVRGFCRGSMMPVLPENEQICIDLILSEYNPFKLMKDGKLVAYPWDMPPPYPTNSAILSSSLSSSPFSHIHALLPLKKSEPLNLSESLRSYFVLKYSESMAKRVEGLVAMVHKLHNQMLRDDLSLPFRRDCLIRYFKCLCMIEPFFPMNGSPNPPIFVWYNAIDPQQDSSQHNIHLEKASVLFNLVALCTHIALSCDLTTNHGHRLAMDALTWIFRLWLNSNNVSGTFDLSQQYTSMINNEIDKLKLKFCHPQSDVSSLAGYP
ncbi:hypothetical protein S83_053547, partial [Arachis hypogaea]